MKSPFPINKIKWWKLLSSLFDYYFKRNESASKFLSLVRNKLVKIHIFNSTLHYTHATLLFSSWIDITRTGIDVTLKIFWNLFQVFYWKSQLLKYLTPIFTWNLIIIQLSIKSDRYSQQKKEYHRPVLISSPHTQEPQHSCTQPPALAQPAPGPCCLYDDPPSAPAAPVAQRSGLRPPLAGAGSTRRGLIGREMLSAFGVVG